MRDPFDICAMIVKEECYLDREPMCDFERAIAGTGQAIIDRIKCAYREHPAQADRIEALEAALRKIMAECSYQSAPKPRASLSYRIFWSSLQRSLKK